MVRERACYAAPDNILWCCVWHWPTPEATHGRLSEPSYCTIGLQRNEDQSHQTYKGSTTIWITIERMVKNWSRGCDLHLRVS
jgi:hypothetical protein